MVSSLRPRLTVVDGSRSGAALEVLPGDGVLLGRSEDCSLRFDRAVVSKLHARVFLQQGIVLIEDLGSTNGTFVNGRQIKGREALDHGAVIGLGEPFVAPQRGAILLQDAADRLLEEMRLFEFASERASSGEAYTDPPADSNGEAPGASLESGDETHLSPAPQLTASAADETVAFELRPRSGRRPAWLAGLVILGLLVAVAVWFARQGSGIGSWGQVRIEPTNVGPQSEIEITSPDIDDSDEFEVLFGGQLVEPSERAAGRIALSIPRLEGLAAGEQAVLLEVRHDRRSLLRTSLVYDVAPEIIAFAPSEVRVGDVLSIRGVGFVAQDSDGEALAPTVEVGELSAEVLSRGADEITVRVPMVTRRKIVEVPVVVQFPGVDPLEARDFVLVAPRIVAPVEFTFSPSFMPGLEAWQVSTPLGTAFYLDEPEKKTQTEAPERVRATCEAFARLFRLASNDETLRVDAVELRSGYALRSLDDRGNEETLVEFSNRDLEATALGGGARVEPHILAFWQATVWNYLLDAFARGKPPAIDEQSPSYHRSLAWLVGNNRQQGGFGRPEQRDLEQLDGASFEILSMVLLQPPRGFGDLSGAWQARLANVFYPTDDIEVNLFLDLDHVAGRLAGEARIEFKDNLAFVRSQTARVRGDVQAGSPPKLILRLVFEEPVGPMVLDGVARNLGLEGTFKAGDRRPGQWYASRVEEAVE